MTTTTPAQTATCTVEGCSAGRCEWCGQEGPTHLSQQYTGGRGYALVEHCCNSRACSERQARRGR